MNISNQFLSIEQLQDQYLKNSGKASGITTKDGQSFGQIFNQKTQDTAEAAELKFSKHAMNRLEERNIALTDNQLERLSDGTKKAGEKGINESLVLVDSLAFIVNVNNNTVITAMDQTQASDNVFTNIDGAVIN